MRVSYANFALQLAARAYVMESGLTSLQGEPRLLLHDPKEVSLTWTKCLSCKEYRFASCRLRVCIGRTLSVRNL